MTRQLNRPRSVINPSRSFEPPEAPTLSPCLEMEFLLRLSAMAPKATNIPQLIYHNFMGIRTMEIPLINHN